SEIALGDGQHIQQQRLAAPMQTGARVAERPAEPASRLGDLIYHQLGGHQYSPSTDATGIRVARSVSSSTSPSHKRLASRFTEPGKAGVVPSPFESSGVELLSATMAFYLPPAETKSNHFIGSCSGIPRVSTSFAIARTRLRNHAHLPSSSK